MTFSIRACPLCGSTLTPTKFARVMRHHRGLEEQLAKLRRAEERAKLRLRQATAEGKAAAAKAREKASRQVEAERRRAADRLKKHQMAAQKLRGRIDDLERRLKLGETAQSEGLLEERALLAFLTDNFSNDQFEHVGRGGDILQDVCTDRGTKVGRIVYEVKRVQQWASGHVGQCAEARVSREADLAILVTNRFPAKRQHYFVERGVLVISPLGLLPLVHTAREGLLNIHSLRVSGDQKKRAVEAVYDYLAAGRYSEHIRQVAQHFSDLEVLFHKELKSHKKVWDSRLGHYRGIVKGVASIHDRLRTLITPGAQHRPLPAAAKALLPHFAVARPRR